LKLNGRSNTSSGNRNSTMRSYGTLIINHAFLPTNCSYRTKLNIS
jgi:hypothetical protein